MKLMRKYRGFVCAVLILCFFSFHISRPRQALAIVPAVSLAAAAVLAVGAAAGLSYTFDNANAESIAGRLQTFLDDVHPGTAIADYFSARGAAVKDGLMYIGRSLYNRIKEYLQWEVSSNSLSAGNSVLLNSSAYGFDTINGIHYDLTTMRDSNGNFYLAYDGTCYVLEEGDIFVPVTSQSVASFPEIVFSITDDYYMKYLVEYDSQYSSYYFRGYYSSDAGVNWTRHNSQKLSNFLDNSTYTYFLTVTPAYYTTIQGTALTDYIVPIGRICRTRSNWDYIECTLSPLSTFPWTAAQLQGSTDIDVTLASSLSLTASDVISYPDVSEGQSVCVDVGMLTGSTIDEVSDEIIDAAIDGTLSPSISAETWTVDVVTTPQELAQDLDQDLTTDVEDNPTVPDTERIEFDPPAHYTVRDLRTFFPFCIPFDLFDMLGVLAAQPVAPHFEYRFQPGIANIDYTIVIDFQQFDSVALLLRRLETLSFCIGLAMVTRNLIRG